MSETESTDVPEVPSVSAELSSGIEGAIDLADDRPELAVAAAFAGGLVLALLIRRLVNR